MFRFGTSNQSKEFNYDDLYNFPSTGNGSNSSASKKNNNNSDNNYDYYYGISTSSNNSSQQDNNPYYDSLMMNHNNNNHQNGGSGFDYDTSTDFGGSGSFGTSTSTSTFYGGDIIMRLRYYISLFKHIIQTTNPIKLCIISFVLITLLGYTGKYILFFTLRSSSSNGNDTDIQLFESGPGAKYLDPLLHQKASVMTMGPPFDRLRDVVWDQPYRASDTIVYWQTPNVGENIIPKMLSDCFQLTLTAPSGSKYDNEQDLRIHNVNGYNYINVDTTTLEGIERAEELDLITKHHTMVDVIVTSHVREISDIFTWDNQGRMFAFFRHPIEREDYLSSEENIRDNYMTRLIINKWDGELNFVDLGNAKKVIREKCIVGVLDDEYKLESLLRIQKYYGWESSSQICIEEYLNQMPTETYGDLVDGTDEYWTKLHPHNIYDVQLYEFARSTFRAQRQTIVPLAKQFELFGDPENQLVTEENNKE